MTIHPANARTGIGICASGSFNMPTRAEFGRGVMATAGEEARRLGGTSALVVTDPGVRAAGLADGVVQALREAGLAVHIYDRVQPNPRDVHCVEGAEVARELGADLLVGVGGGSAIDTAKCIGVLLRNGGHPRDWEDFGALRDEPVPTIAVPTTAGTGSEVSPSAIITDTVRRKKMNLFDPRICPRVALVDPDLTLTAPPGLTAATGMDALSHAVDSLHCRLDTPASDAMALEGARLVALHLRRAVERPDDAEARCGMAQASLVAGLAVGITDVSGCHCLAEAMGAVYDLPHGICCAATMPVIMEYNLPVAAAKYARLAHAFGIDTAGMGEQEAARAAVGYVRDLNRALGIAELGSLIRPEDLDLLAEKAAANTSAPSNPRDVDTAAFRAMFAEALPAHAA
jgi:alcohol dehydrogenase class IV